MRSLGDEPDEPDSHDGAGGGHAGGGGPAGQPGRDTAADDGVAADGAGASAAWGSGELARLVADVRGAERQLAQAVVAAGRLAGSGEAEAQAGMPLEQVLVIACRLTGADRHALITAGQLLGHMPGLCEQFLAGEVSWGQVRGICRRAKWLSPARLAELDARLAATIAARGSLTGFDPDELVDAAGDAVAELVELDRVERDERDRVADSFVAIQPDFFGGVRAYGELDAQLAAPLLAALQAASPPPHAGQAPKHQRHGAQDTSDGNAAGHGDGHDDAGRAQAGQAASQWSGPARSRQHAQGLARLASEWLAGTGQPTTGDARGDGANGNAGEGCGAAGEPAGVADGDAGGTGGAGGPVTARPARPQLVVHVDLAQATAAVAGHVDLAARGPLPRLTAAAVETLACSGEVQAVVFDGARPLATTAKITAATVPAATHRAVEARDRGCRWPGCQAPLAHTELHHLITRAEGGTHRPGNLLCLCRRHHLQAHGHDWTLHVDVDTATVTGWRHGRHRWTSHPPATRLATPPPTGDAPDDTDGRDPPAGGTDGTDGRDPPHDDGPSLDHDGHPLPF